MKLLGLSKEEVRKALENGNVKVAVYGLGKMGLPLAAVFADKGARVIGVDIKKEIVDSVNAGKNHLQEEPGLSGLVERNVRAGRLSATLDGVDAAKNSDVQLIIIPTLLKTAEKVADLEPVRRVAAHIRDGFQRGSIVIVECTTPPGATESLSSTLSEKGFRLGADYGLAYAPERTMSGTAIRDITSFLPKIIGADSPTTLDAVDGVYSIVCSKGTIRLSSILAAECVKVFEGVYRFVNIGLANELSLYTQELGVDAEEIFRACNTNPYSHIHKAGANVGGHCIPIYPHFILSEKTRIIEAAIKLNDHMPLVVVDLLEKAFREINATLSSSNILLLGLTFRGGVKEFANSAAFPVIAELKKRQANVFAFDPLCGEQDAQNFGVQFSNDYARMDALVLLADHKEFNALNWLDVTKQLRKKIVIDGRGVVDKNAVRQAGGIFYGIGRL